VNRILEIGHVSDSCAQSQGPEVYEVYLAAKKATYQVETYVARILAGRRISDTDAPRIHLRHVSNPYRRTGPYWVWKLKIGYISVCDTAQQPTFRAHTPQKELDEATIAPASCEICNNGDGSR
jgi:hypothetical protein